MCVGRHRGWSLRSRPPATLWDPDRGRSWPGRRVEADRDGVNRTVVERAGIGRAGIGPFGVGRAGVGCAGRGRCLRWARGIGIGLCRWVPPAPDRPVCVRPGRRRIVGPLGRRTVWFGHASRPAGPGWGKGWPVGPTRWGTVCGGDPGGRFSPASVMFTRGFWHPGTVHSAGGGRHLGWSLRSTLATLWDADRCRSWRGRGVAARDGGCARGVCVGGVG
jgi:hypothetical protein